MGFAVEVAEATARLADIRNVHIAVYLPSYYRRVIDSLTAQGVGNATKQLQRCIVVYFIGFGTGQWLVVERLLQNSVNSHNWLAFVDKYLKVKGATVKVYAHNANTNRATQR